MDIQQFDLTQEFRQLLQVLADLDFGSPRLRALLVSLVVGRTFELFYKLRW